MEPSSVLFELEMDMNHVEYFQEFRPLLFSIAYRMTGAHLNDFLFRNNDEINKKCSFLSGGEKARLSMAILAAKMPELIILDEVTNNIDIMTKNHLIQVLESYNGAMIIVSHDIDFLSQLKVDKKILITDGTCKEAI